MCSAALTPEHQHLIQPAERKLLCCCDGCAILFSGRQSAKYLRVPRDVYALPDFCMTDAQWESLHIPIDLAFFFQSTAAERVVAIFPGPAGATESLLTLEAWTDLVADNPVLAAMEPDVEALLVNRVGQTREYFRVPIDHCYHLVGLLRLHWRGLSGGTEVWREIGGFFAGLKARSRPVKGESHA